MVVSSRVVDSSHYNGCCGTCCVVQCLHGDSLPSAGTRSADWVERVVLSYCVAHISSDRVALPCSTCFNCIQKKAPTLSLSISAEI